MERRRRRGADEDIISRTTIQPVNLKTLIMWRDGQLRVQSEQACD